MLSRLRDKRRARRHAIGAEFPLRASILLRGSAERPDQARPWGGRVTNVSSRGLSVRLSPAATSKRGEETRLTVALDGLTMELPCRVAHFRVANDHAVCGVALGEAEPAVLKGYLQLLEAVVMGSTLAPWRSTGLLRDPPGMRREQYRSEAGTQLYAWRHRKTRALDCFEFVFGDVCLRGEAEGPPTVAVYTRTKAGRGGKVAWSDHRLALSDGAHAEARQLFRYVAGNVATAVSADVRRLMRTAAGA